MKKKILFIISNFGEGGVSKSLVNLLNIIDNKRYEINVLACNPSGLLTPLVPKSVRIISDARISALTGGFRGLRDLIRNGNICLAIASLFRIFISGFSKSKSGLLLARLMPPIDGYFDVIIDYNGQHQLYYMVNKLNALKKYTFFHNDYSKWPYYYMADKEYFPKVDGIYTISDICAESLRKYFPAQANKIGVIPNLTSLQVIEGMANDEDAPEIDGSVPSIVTLGHLCKRKGTDLALHAALILKKKNIKYNWYFIGKNSNDVDYSGFISKNDLSECVHLLGLKINPYPYIYKSTLFVLPSKFEGKSIALDEAKLLCKPVVVTNFSTVGDQFTDRHNASICEMNADSLADAIAELLSDSTLRERYSQTLLRERRDNSSEIQKLYALFDE